MGAILVLLLVFYPILKLWHYTYNEWEQGKQRSTWNITLGIIGSIYAILFLFDHYFYTIWPSQLLLWLIIGLIMASINTSQNNKRA